MSLASQASPKAGATDPPFGVVDLHVDIPWQVHFKGRAPQLPDGQARLEALRAGHYVGLVFPIYLPDTLPRKGPSDHSPKHPAEIADADAILATIEGIIAKSPDFLPLGAAAAEEGKISTFLSIEGAGAFAKDITAIDRFIDRGLRLVSPCHGKNSPLASSATGEKVDWGLTEIGKKLAERVYEKGALVDVSHVSDRAFDDLVPIAKAHGAPIVATHSNARALGHHARDLTDAQLRIIGETGGVAGVNFHAPFVAGSNDATLDDVVRQVEHMVKVAGVAHVAIGSDFDGGIRPAEGLEDAARMPALAHALLARGMSRDDVLAIFGLNALRVLGWRPAPHDAKPAAPPTPAVAESKPGP